MLAVDAFEGSVVLVLNSMLLEMVRFVFVFGEGFEPEHAEGVRAVIDFHLDGVDEKTTVFFIPFNFYL